MRNDFIHANFDESTQIARSELRPARYISFIKRILYFQLMRQYNAGEIEVGLFNIMSGWVNLEFTST